VARAAQALAVPGGALGAGLRDAGRREGGGGARSRAPARAEARALGRAAPLRRHRPRHPRSCADAVRRTGRAGSAARPRAMTRGATGKLRVYVLLAGLGLLGALAFGRPELAALAAPFALSAGARISTGRMSASPTPANSAKGAASAASSDRPNA